jgi:large subunit ribosomal protein L28
LPDAVAEGTLGRSIRTQEDFMARVCDICGKGVQFGQNVSHAHNITKRRWEVNLQPVRAVVAGKPRRLRVCTRCIRSGAVQKGMRQKEAQRARAV